MFFLHEIHLAASSEGFALYFFILILHYINTIHFRIVGLHPAFTKQALLNRQNPKIYNVFANILGEKVNFNFSSLVYIDNIEIFK